MQRTPGLVESASVFAETETRSAVERAWANSGFEACWRADAVDLAMPESCR